MERVIGRAIRIDLPAFNLRNLPAKVDTGAYSASIDCERAQVIEHDGRQLLEFILLRPGRDGYTGQTQRTDHFERTEVKNANGVQQRFVIFTDVMVDGQQTQCRFTLTDRSALRYPVLIGRRFLREAHYLVDVRQGEGLPDDEEERQL